MAENIQLSDSFFQEFAEDFHHANPNPVLQITQARMIEQGTTCMRVRMSDGTFSYTQCAFANELLDRIKEDGLNEPERFAVIKILNYKSDNANGKPKMVIIDYEILAIDIPKIGNPTCHTGDAETFRGYGATKRRLAESTDAYSAGTPRKVARTEPDAGGPTVPFTAISPYISGRWRICGVVSGKEEMRQINSKKGPMKVFSFVLNDKDGQAIKITAFAETAEKFYPQIQDNTQYYVSGQPSCIRPANKRFNSTGHDYELTLNNDSVIEESAEQNIEAPKFMVKKTPLDKIASRANDSVDVLAVIDKVEDIANIKTKDNREVSRRNVHLIDETSTSVTLTLWGDQASSFAGEKGRILGIKNAFVREFNSTYSLSTNSGARMEIDPQCKDTEMLYEWYENERPNAETKSISTQANAGGGKFLEEARSFAVYSNPSIFLHHPNGIYFSTVGCITAIRSDNALYQSCPSKDCQKKVTPQDDGFRCDKCNMTYPNFKYRYMVSTEITDACGPTWTTLFNDRAESFFGKTAAEMGELQLSDPEAYKAVFDSKLFTIHFFRCRASFRTHNDVGRSQIQVFEIRQPNFEHYGQALDQLAECLEKLD